jgi:hypothetical protein
MLVSRSNPALLSGIVFVPKLPSVQHVSHSLTYDLLA